MSRKKGVPWYPKKSKFGTYYITRLAHLKMQAAARRVGKSDSDIIEYCLRHIAPTITKETQPAVEPLEVAR